MLTTKQKADWADQYTSAQWEAVMSVKAFPSVMDALTAGDTALADQRMLSALNNAWALLPAHRSELMAA
jgi:hypothetical protein